MAATKSSSKKQSSSRDQKPSTNKPGNGRWVAGVKTVSTFPPKVHEGRSHHRQVARFEQGFAQKDQAAECGCLSISFIARDAASARLGANWGSGLSERSGSRRDKRPTNAESSLIGAQALASATLRGQSVVRDRRSCLSAASRLPVRASQKGQFVACMTKLEKTGSAYHQIRP
jgi:hypothetical protein